MADYLAAFAVVCYRPPAELRQQPDFAGLSVKEMYTRRTIEARAAAVAATAASTPASPCAGHATAVRQHFYPATHGHFAAAGYRGVLRRARFLAQRGAALSGRF